MVSICNLLVRAGSSVEITDHDVRDRRTARGWELYNYYDDFCVDRHRNNESEFRIQDRVFPILAGDVHVLPCQRLVTGEPQPPNKTLDTKT